MRSSLSLLFVCASLALPSLFVLGCDSGGGPGGGPMRDAGPVDAAAPDDTCGSVRLTMYGAEARGWCEMDSTLPFLPQFVRDRMTIAIAEPWNGSSYGGMPGEACGECWEIDTLYGTQIMMVDNLCPNMGNPLCQGSTFHMDLSQEAARAVMGGGLDEGQARRVPCPVTGNIHVLVNDENVTYMRVAFMNHRIPIRTVEFRGTGAGVEEPNEYMPLQRSGGAWEVIGGGRQVDRGGTGVQFRITSAQGQVVESMGSVPGHPPRRSTFDLGVQFDDLMPSGGGACDFQVPGDVYDDAWGGIEHVGWQIDPWGAAEGGFFGEVSDGCFGGSGSCVRLDTFGQFSGAHIYYRQSFPTSSFSRVTLRARSASGPAELNVSLSNEGMRCNMSRHSLTEEWSEISIDIAGCALPMLNAITIENPGAATYALMLDDIRFE